MDYDVDEDYDPETRPESDTSSDSEFSLPRRRKVETVKGCVGALLTNNDFHNGVRRMAAFLGATVGGIPPEVKEK
jgi:hypothetical protein